MPTHKFILTVRTAFNLKPSQISWRLLRDFQKKFLNRGLFSESIPPNVSKLDSNWAQTLSSVYRLNDFDAQSYLGGTRTYVGKTVNFKDFPDWIHESDIPLWTYELHYFKEFPTLSLVYQNSQNPFILKKMKNLILNWIQESRPNQTGWDPYPLSTRCLNWILTYHLLEEELGADSYFLQTFQTSLSAQLNFLSNRLEYHLLGNHLFRNIAALLIGGLYLNNNIGNKLFKKWLNIMIHELRKQILGDGSHFERSPLYHALVLRDLLTVSAALKTAGAEIPPLIVKKLNDMNLFLKQMHLQNNSLPLFNDSVRSPEFSIRALTQLSDLFLSSYPKAHFDEDSRELSGYFVFKDRDYSETLVIDAGQPGPRYLQGHAHCDLLSFEYWYQGIPVIVDSGVHGYKGSPFREYSRSTRAHNTVMIDGFEQFEIWDAFRVARQAKQIEGEMGRVQGKWQFKGSYSPYYHPKWKHHRTLKQIQTSEWVILDRVEANRAVHIESFLHFHPDWNLKICNDKIVGQNKKLRVELFPIYLPLPALVIGEKNPVQGWHFPQFGIALPAPTLIFNDTKKPMEEFGYQFKVFYE